MEPADVEVGYDSDTTVTFTSQSSRPVLGHMNYQCRFCQKVFRAPAKHWVHCGYCGRCEILA